MQVIIYCQKVNRFQMPYKHHMTAVSHFKQWLVKTMGKRWDICHLNYFWTIFSSIIVIPLFKYLKIWTYPWIKQPDFYFQCIDGKWRGSQAGLCYDKILYNSTLAHKLSSYCCPLNLRPKSLDGQNGQYPNWKDTVVFTQYSNDLNQYIGSVYSVSLKSLKIRLRPLT